MNISTTLSKKCTDFIGNNADKTAEDLEKIQYGVQVIIINIFKMIILFATAYILGVLKYTCIAFAVFAIFRCFACGVHANSSLQCIIINYIVFLGNVYLSLSFTLNKLVLIILFSISLVLTLLYAPADTAERPLISNKLRNKLKLKSVLVVLIFFTIALLATNSIYSNLITYSILEEAAIITPISYIIFKKSYKNYKNVK